jgi:hypothetical protein
VQPTRTAMPCCQSASANQAGKALLLYCSCCAAHRAASVTVLRPHRSGQPARPSTSSSNTSSSSASQSASQAVAPDTLDRQTAQVLAAHQAARQERYDKSAFPAQLAKALRRHGMAVWVGRTSTHVMQGIINELAHLQRT